jgi:hypothetical protein
MSAQDAIVATPPQRAGCTGSLARVTVTTATQAEATAGRRRAEERGDAVSVRRWQWHELLLATTGGMADDAPTLPPNR